MVITQDMYAQRIGRVLGETEKQMQQDMEESLRQAGQLGDGERRLQALIQLAKSEEVCVCGECRQLRCDRTAGALDIKIYIYISIHI